MAFKITPLSLVSGGINTIRTECFAEPGLLQTVNWLNPTYSTPDHAPIYSVNNGMVYVDSNSDISASFETLTNNQNVFNYET